MKLLLLHGAAITSSRKKLLDIKSKFNKNEIVTFEKGADPKDVLASLQTVSMFEGERLFILENPPDDVLKDLPSYTLYPNPCTLTLWFDHEVKKLPKDVEVLFFPEAKEVSIFPLLDSLGSRDKKAFLELAKRNNTSPNDTQYILTMAFYLLRSLVCTPKSAGDFIKKKNERMRKNFKEGELVNLYKSILEIDFKIKKGLMDVNQAEFLLVNKFVSS